MTGGKGEGRNNGDDKGNVEERQGEEEKGMKEGIR